MAQVSEPGRDRRNHTLLRKDRAVLAVPRTAELRHEGWEYAADPSQQGKLIIRPALFERRWGELDFAPAGAELYRKISAEWLGRDWEDDLVVSNGYYWEVHYYCETEDGFEEVESKHEAVGKVRSRRIATIGPRCVSWWERFLAGYKLELKIGEPCWGVTAQA